MGPPRHRHLLIKQTSPDSGDAPIRAGQALRRGGSKRGIAGRKETTKIEHLSDWHTFGANDPSTYPKVESAPIQVRYDSGHLAEGDCQKLLLLAALSEKLQIAAWRYIKDPTIR
jgi:hypothetical protein